MSGKDVELSRLPGWDPHSFGYHGDDGNMFPGRGNGTLYGPTFTKGNVFPRCHSRSTLRTSRRHDWLLLEPRGESDWLHEERHPPGRGF